MKAYEVTAENQKFIVEANTLTEVVAAYEEGDLKQVHCLGEILSLPGKSAPTEKGTTISDGLLTAKADLLRAFMTLLNYAARTEGKSPSFPRLYNMLDDEYMYLKTRGFFNL